MENRLFWGVLLIQKTKIGTLFDIRCLSRSASTQRLQAMANQPTRRDTHHPKKIFLLNTCTHLNVLNLDIYDVLHFLRCMVIVLHVANSTTQHRVTYRCITGSNWCSRPNNCRHTDVQFTLCWRWGMLSGGENQIIPVGNTFSRCPTTNFYTEAI